MSAWKTLLADRKWCRGTGAFPLPAYSEFTPPPWLGIKPYGASDTLVSPQSSDSGWLVSEYEQEQELTPGLEYLARGLLRDLIRLGRGEPTHHLTHERLKDNPYWPPELAARAGQLPHERYVLLASVALSRTQDDKGRVRWTFFGASEQGPAKAFWRGFFRGPRDERPRAEAMSFFKELLGRCYGVPEKLAADQRRAGVRYLPAGRDADFRHWDEGPVPSWAKELLYSPGEGLAEVRYLLTFRPFAELPAQVREAYLGGRLHLWPFPGSLAFWGVPGFRKLTGELTYAMQLPMATLFPRCNDLHGVRIPQSGYLNEKETPDASVGTEHRPRFVRTHRWQKVQRHEDEVALVEMGDPVTQVLFSTEPDDIALYNKPMARNVRIWSRDYKMVLDGPRQGAYAIERAERALAKGGTYGYRFIFPPMRVGRYAVYWQRPVAAFAGPDPGQLPDSSVLLKSAPAGYLTAYRVDQDDLAKPVELWPVFARRPEHLAAIDLFRHEHQPHRWHTTTNVRKLLEWHELLGRPLSPSLADALVTQPRDLSMKDWVASLPDRSSDPAAAKRLVSQLRRRMGKEPPPGEGLTYAATATRDFEERYWRTIAFLAHGRFRTKSVADCVRDEPTREALPTNRRELDPLAEHLLAEHAKTIAAAGVRGAWVASHEFAWTTDFDLSWMGGWKKSQAKPNQERNIIVRVPGRNAREAVILADHYDTAYMHDRYYLKEGGTGARVAAAGADDNHSATAMLLLAAPVLLELSKAGTLGCDVWLVHLTGEEFPSDCLGARHLSRDLVEGTLAAKEPDGTVRDLSKTRVRGLYVCDMIAHNNLRNKYVFQIAPGEGAASARLAELAHEATMAWNALAAQLNRKQPRKGAAPPTRSDDPDRIPPLSPHARLRDDVRPQCDPRSTLFNTDGQIFSDVGIPAVLFMEDYDISRVGYHDMHDTMENIDLDYGAALAAIAIESAARAAGHSGSGLPLVSGASQISAMPTT
jgi:hypothetical protein